MWPLLKMISQAQRAYPNQGNFFLEHYMRYLFASRFAKNNYRGSTSPFHSHEFGLKELRQVLQSNFAPVKIYGQQLKNPKLLAQEKSFFNLYQKLTLGQSLIKKFYLLIPTRIKAFFQKLIIGQSPQALTHDFIITQKDLNQAITFLAVCQNKP